MKRLKYSIFPLLCFISVILFCITFFFRWYFLGSTFYLYAENSIEVYFASPVFQQIQSQDANELYNAYLEEKKKPDITMEETEKNLTQKYADTNFLFVLTDTEQPKTISNTNKVQIPGQAVYSFQVTGTNQIITIKCGIIDPPTYEDNYTKGLTQYQLIYQYRDLWGILYTIFFCIGMVSFLVFAILLYRRKKSGTPTNSKILHLPIEANSVLLLTSLYGIFGAGKFIIKPMTMFQTIFITFLICVLLLTALAFVSMNIMVTQLATKTVKKYSLYNKLAIKLNPYLQKWTYKKKMKVLFLVVILTNFLGYFFADIYNIYNIFFYLNGGLSNLFYVLVYSPWSFVIGQIPLIITVAFGVWLYKTTAQQQNLLEKAKQVSISPLDTTLEIEEFSGVTKELGITIQDMQESLQKALTQQIKSDKTKTQLISNVSHDIKTPLTSIVNYIELLRRNNGQQPMQEEYLAVLTRQSMRLKKMCEDIVDASRFSAQDVQMEKTKINLYAFVEQMVAEYEYRFKEQSIMAVTSIPKNITILADGDLLWRIFDNLLSNVAKYSQPNTRFYLQAEIVNIEKTNQVKISFLNISKQKLNMPVEDLLQRFVQGDISRYTEGSGLGLSIVQDLVSLQDGTLSLKIEGDLFSATIFIPQVTI